jgi:hypothetical protein
MRIGTSVGRKHSITKGKCCGEHNNEKKATTEQQRKSEVTPLLLFI